MNGSLLWKILPPAYAVLALLNAACSALWLKAGETWGAALYALIAVVWALCFSFAANMLAKDAC